MIEVIGDEEGSLIFYCYNMLFVFFQSYLRIFFSYPLHCWQKGYQNIFKLINFFLCFCWCMIWKIIIKKTSGWRVCRTDECSLCICLYIHICLLSLKHWPAYWLTVWSLDFLTKWPVSRQIELTTWAMTTGWLTDGLIICLTVFRTLHLASGHGYY